MLGDSGFSWEKSRMLIDDNQVLIEDEVLKGGINDEIDNELERENQDIEDDTIRRHHFNYTEYSCLVNGHPEIFLDSEGNQVNNFII